VITGALISVPVAAIEVTIKLIPLQFNTEDEQDLGTQLQWTLGPHILMV
jgi:hypothetical protein